MFGYSVVRKGSKLEAECEGEAGGGGGTGEREIDGELLAR